MEPETTEVPVVTEPVEPVTETQAETLLREIRDHLAEEDEPISALLKRAATYLVPSGVIGTIGKLCGLSDASTAAVTLAIFVLLFIWHYRLAIEVRIRTWMILAVVVVLISSSVVFRRTLTSFLLERSITKATGIVDYAPHSNEYLPRIGELIDGAHHDIYFSGVNFYLSLPQYRDRLLKKLQEGVEVRFLVFDPLAPTLIDLAQGFNQTPGELRSECITTVENLRGLITESRNQKTKGTIEVRLFSTSPRTRIYIFDRKSEDGRTFFIPHVDQHNSALLPGFLARNIQNGVAAEYFLGVDRIWSASKKWDDFITEYDAKKP